jgi:tRNA (mo5U34)-methyltransferase
MIRNQPLRGDLMNLHQRILQVVAAEGVSGVIRRGYRKLFTRPIQQQQQWLDEHDRLRKAFLERARQLGFYEEVKDYFWYHTIDLGNGLITPGYNDYRGSWPTFKFPPDMAGMNVLDVGSATGFFAFEFERGGAAVTSIEIPSYDDVDRLPGETTQDTFKKFERLWVGHAAPAAPPPPASLEGMYRCNVEGPFAFCHRVLGSKVRRHYSNIYDLSEEKIGKGGFDLVFLGDIILHTLHPLKALASVAPLCRGTLVISQELHESYYPPMMCYRGGDKAGQDGFDWWLPNVTCLEQLLKKMGFKKVEAVGRLAGGKTVLHASR